MDNTLHVRAVDGASVTLVSPEGVVLTGRYAGRAKDGTPLPEGEKLHDHAHYQRAIRRGELKLVEARKADASPKAVG